MNPTENNWTVLGHTQTEYQDLKRTLKSRECNVKLNDKLQAYQKVGSTDWRVGQPKACLKKKEKVMYFRRMWTGASLSDEDEEVSSAETTEYRDATVHLRVKLVLWGGDIAGRERAACHSAAAGTCESPCCLLGISLKRRWNLAESKQWFWIAEMVLKGWELPREQFLSLAHSAHFFCLLSSCGMSTAILQCCSQARN